MLSFLANNHPFPTSDVTICAESAIYIAHFCEFATKRDCVS